jgi:DUF1680 family protein
MAEAIDRARRELLQLGALCAALPLTARAACPPGGGTEPLTQLGYHQLRLARGPLLSQAQQNHALLLNMDEDALLRPFRIRAGMPAPGHDMGGWYDTDAFAPGATFGQWISALSRYYAITGDAPTQAKVHRLVRAYAATIDAEGKFYRNNRFPAYIYDKLVGGLVDARTLTHDATAVRELHRTTMVAEPYLPPHAMPHNENARPGEDFSQHAWDESYTLAENQFLALQLTGDEHHGALARRFLYDDFFGSLARGENVLPGKHAYSHVNCLSSAARAYLSLGTPLYLDAARNGFDMIDAQSYATGGWGPAEHFIVPGSGGLGESLKEEVRSFETPCGSYAHFKLTRYLLRITRDPRYGDSMERVLYNTVLGALPIQPDGHAFYYSDYTRHASKGFFSERWPCCSGTLPMIAADYAISGCFTDATGLYVNLYVPAQVSWRQGGADCRLSIQTGYPHAPDIHMSVQVQSPQTFTIHLRIPAWAAGARVRINGRSLGAPPQPGTFAAICREWRSGDRLELELPLLLRLQSVDPEHPDTVALLAGPLVLMRVPALGSGAAPALTREELLSARNNGPGTQDWKVDAAAETVRLLPFTAISGERYSTYLDVRPA